MSGPHQKNRRNAPEPRKSGPRPHAPGPRDSGGDSEPRLIFGTNPVREALRGGGKSVVRVLTSHPPDKEKELFELARKSGVSVERVPRERLDDLAQGGVHQGVAAYLPPFEYFELEDIIEAAAGSDRPGLIVVLDGIVDPHNLGAIIRSAYALGAHGVVIAKDRAAQVNGLVSKSSAGATEHCRIARVTNIARTLETLKEAGYWTAAAEPEGSSELERAKLDGPLAVVIGAEGPGVRENVLRHCDFRLRIPMIGELASLNASVSAGILLYEILRQRLQPKVP